MDSDRTSAALDSAAGMAGRPPGSGSLTIVKRLFKNTMDSDRTSATLDSAAGTAGWPPGSGKLTL